MVLSSKEGRSQVLYSRRGTPADVGVKEAVVDPGAGPCARNLLEFTSAGLCFLC